MFEQKKYILIVLIEYVLKMTIHTRELSLTLSGRLPEDSKQKILLLYILCLLGVEVTEFHLGV